MRSPRNRHVPGEPGIWVLICGELFVFSLFFLAFVYYRGLEAELFAQSQKTLNQNIGLLNTVFLLTSSLLVAMGVHRVREGMPRAGMLFGGAIALGCAFGVAKLFEYAEKLLAGISIADNSFYILYFAFTGIHFLHVLLGLAVLVFLCRAARDRKTAAGRMVLFESGASFWHLVDLLWIVLFSLIYLA